MKLGFYKVNNSKNYDRHTFDDLYDKPEEIERMLAELPDEEIKIFSASAYGYGGTAPWPNLADFEEDYNNEELDLGWWFVVLRYDEPKYVWVFSGEQTWEDKTADIVIEIFSTEDAAHKYMKEFINDNSTDESIAEYVERKKWEVEYNTPDLYRAFRDGHYSSDHIELTITKCEIKK